MQAVLHIKLNCWSKLPWHLCGLAHHDASVAQAVARRCLQMYDDTPEQTLLLHHPLSITLSKNCPSRLLVEKLAHGCHLNGLPPEFVQVVSSFKFIPIAERIVEAKHKDVKRALQRLTRHSAARVSMAVREIGRAHV